MKVLMLNGSPHEYGCSAEMLKIMSKQFAGQGVETEIVWIGTKPINGCVACKQCVTTNRCAIDDGVNEFVDKLAQCDGLVIACPVLCSSAPGALVSFLNRVIYSARGKRDIFAFKPAVGVVTARRAGTTSTIDMLNRCLTYMEMLVVSGRYWPAVHGQIPEEIYHDEEGVQVLEDLSDNMTWFMRCRQAADDAGIPLPVRNSLPKTNFVRVK